MVNGGTGGRANICGFEDEIKEIYLKYGEGEFTWHDVKQFMRKSPKYYTNWKIFNIKKSYDKRGVAIKTYSLSQYYIEKLKNRMDK